MTAISGIYSKRVYSSMLQAADCVYSSMLQAAYEAAKQGTTLKRSQGRINLTRSPGVLASGLRRRLCVALKKCSIGWLKLWPVSSEISDLLLFASYMKFG